MIATLDTERITVFNAEHDGGSELLQAILNDPAVVIVDTWPDQVAALAKLRPTPASDLQHEQAHWIYYPWRRTVVKLLGPRSYRRLRLDRNRNLVTIEEQDRLGRLRIGIVGLSSGHAIAHSLAMAGFCGELRLTDFDDLEISNLNRVPATVFDIGLNKATAAMRRIAELDPYLAVHHTTTGLTAGSVDAFLDGLDVVVEQCDSLEVKLQLREHARARGIPVLMATSDRGLIDVERFDLEPTRRPFHGMLGDTDAEALAGLSTTEKLPFVLRIFDPDQASTRMGASLLEVDRTLSAWPQLAGELAVGAAAMLECIRRIGLNEPLASGRAQMDISELMGQMRTPVAPAEAEPTTEPAASAPATGLGNVVDAAVAAAIRAPSGGNSQPWRIEATPQEILLSIDPARTSMMDVGYRGSAVAIGAAAFNARVAAAANGFASETAYTERGADRPLEATVRLRPGDDDGLARWYPAVLDRETNRKFGTGATLAPNAGALLTQVAHQYRTRLHLAVDRDEIVRMATIFAAADRIRYLTADLHSEMVSELRWPGDADMDFGIDVRSLELDRGSLSLLSLLRRTDVLSTIDDWDAGTTLGADTLNRMSSSSGFATVLIEGTTLTSFARGGAATAAVWAAAQECGLAVQPVSPPFLYALDAAELAELSDKHAAELGRLQASFTSLTGKELGESIALTLRLSEAAPASVPSRRSIAVNGITG